MPREANHSTPLGQAVRERREELGLTQETLAHTAGLATKRVWEIERREANPTHATLLAIAAAMHMPVELLTLRAGVIAGDRERHARES